MALKFKPLLTTLLLLLIITYTKSDQVTEITDSTASKSEVKKTDNEQSTANTNSKENSATSSKESEAKLESSSTSASQVTSEAEKEEDKDIAETEKMREEYYYWIKFKNSFTYDKDQKAMLARSFKPETSGYVASNLGKAWFMYLLAGIFGAFLILYLVGRFVLNKFKGPKSHISPWFGRVSWLFIIIGFVCTMVFYSITLSKSLKIK